MLVDPQDVTAALNRDGPLHSQPQAGQQGRHEFWDRRPLFAWCRDMGAARLVPPPLILAEVLARVRVAAGHRLRVPAIVGSEAPLNVGFILADGTGGGKTTAGAIAEAAGLKVHQAGLGTAEGIAAAYGEVGKDGMEWKRRSVLFSSDEAEGALTIAARPGNAIMPAIRTIISGSSLIVSYRTNPVELRRGEYAAAIIIAGQPLKLAPLLTGDEIAGGTPQRFLWLPGGYPDCPDPGQPEPAGSAPIHLPRVDQARGLVGYPDTIWTEVRNNRVAELRGAPDAIDSHLMLTRLKLAAVLALADRRTDVDRRDWADAGELVRVSRATIDRVRGQIDAHQHVRTKAQGTAEGHRLAAADGIREAAARGRVARRIAEHVHDHAAAGGCIRKCIRGYLAARDRADLDAAADLAAANGWIVPGIRQDQSGRGGEVPLWLPGRKP